jgi:hypothetical protein
MVGRAGPCRPGGHDAFTFEPITSPYLVVADDLVVRTPYSRTVIVELRAVPWARWDPASKAWRVPFRSFEELRRHWPTIEAAARQAEPEERRKREEIRKASPEHEDRRAEAAGKAVAPSKAKAAAVVPIKNTSQGHCVCGRHRQSGV